MLHCPDCDEQGSMERLEVDGDDLVYYIETIECPDCRGDDIVRRVLEYVQVDYHVENINGQEVEGGEVDREVKDTERPDDGLICRDCGYQGDELSEFAPTESEDA